jgi:hypothetical protein
LTGSDCVIQLEAIIVDDQQETVKGLLISFAERGALADLLYDYKGEISWEDRVRWAQQAVQGLGEIHDEGYVQGDFTLSNIVVDSEDNAKIIDINRRGCPVGWEPPEIAKKIQSNQRISMYIGEKSDIYQLGMTLWALAMDDDEPERHDVPLSTEAFPPEVPRWYKDIVDICLQEKPRNRLCAKELLKMFPGSSASPTRPTLHGHPTPGRAIDKRYIEPSAAVEREDIERLGCSRPHPTEDDFTSHDSTADPVFTDARSSSYQFDSGSSYVGVTRGRRPASNVAHLETSHPRHQDSGLGDIDMPEARDSEPQIIPISPNFDREYGEIDLGGTPYLISRQSFDTEELDILEGHARGRRRSVQNTLSKLEPITQEMAEPSSARHSDYQKGNEEIEEEIELEQDHIQTEQPPFGESSITSGSTPRNSSSVLTFVGTYVLPSQPLDLVTADLAGLGGHPSLDEHSPHEPKAMLASQFMADVHGLQDPPAPQAQTLFQPYEDSDPIPEPVPAQMPSQPYEDNSPIPEPVPAQTPSQPYEDSSPIPEPVPAQTLSQPYEDSDPIPEPVPAQTPSQPYEDSDPIPEPVSAQTPSQPYKDSDPIPEHVSAQTPSQPYEDSSPIPEHVPAHDLPLTERNSDTILQSVAPREPHLQDPQPGDESAKVVDTTPAVSGPQQVENHVDKHYDDEMSNMATTVTNGQDTISGMEESIYHEIPTTPSSIVQPTDQQTTEQTETQPQSEA